MIDRLIQRLNGRMAYVIVGELWLGYTLLALLGPQAPNAYHLSQVKLLLIELTIALPVLGIWLIATYGAVHFKFYTFIIKESADGRALSRLTDGLILLILSFILQTILGVLPRYVVGTPAINWVVFMHNHVPMLVALYAAWNIFEGSDRLAQLVKASSSTRRLAAVLVPFTLAASVFSGLFYSHISHVVTNGIPNFSVPGAWPFYTLALPYVIIWLLGTLALTNIVTYIRQVKGAIYKVALRNLAYGMFAVISFTALLQLFTLTATSLAKLTLGPILLIIYGLLMLYSLGFVFIAMGARKLAKIEVVK